MQGKHVSLWPYVRGYAARDLPHLLWQMIEEAGDWKHLLWTNSYTDTRVPKFGDLVDWVYYMHDPTNEKAWLMVADNETGDIAGLIWFSQIREDSAWGSIWVKPAYRGKQHSREMVRLALDYGHDQMHWSTIHAVTPWPVVRNLIKRCGFKDVALLPKVLGPDVFVLAHTKEGN